jgi:hypothetical protein
MHDHSQGIAMLKRFKNALLALLGEPAGHNAKSQSSGCDISPSSVGDCSADGGDPGFDHHTFGRLSQLFHYYHQLGEIVDRMRRMAIGHVEEKERSDHRDEIEQAAGPSVAASGSQGRL